MRSTLYIKFIFIYAIFGFLSIFCVASLTPELMLIHMREQTANALYQKASRFSTDHLSNYFSESISVLEVGNQLSVIQECTSASIWFVAQDGTMIASSVLNGHPASPQKITNFNPAEQGNASYMLGTYHDYFEEDVITVIMPVTSDSGANGYLLVHQPYSILEAEANELLQPVYITVLVIFLLSFSILIAFQFFVYRPLRHITEAAQQYASGNLDYEIPVNSQDEIGYLSASLNYMSTQLRDMDDYQKKFIGNVSHDFRSPLTSIKGYLEAMADGTIPPEMQERYFKILLFETERLKDLTEDLLTLNEFDTKSLLLDRTTFDILEVIKNTVSSFEGICTQRKISIELHLASKMLNVNADRKKIQQVLYNLLDNAIKFSPNDSEVTIETREKSGKVYVSVKDNGIGIPKKSIPKIWDRFYKTDLSRGKDKKGTGLGLAIVKEIIQAHNENINVISTEDVGTEFIFSLSKQ